MPRSPIPPKVRWQVLARDGFRCRYCGAEGGEAVLVVDHHTPVAKGGSNHMWNLITACEECNQGKSDSVTPTFTIMAVYREAAHVVAHWLRWQFYDFLPDGHRRVEIPSDDLIQVARSSRTYDDALETLMAVAERYNAGYFGPEWPGLGINGLTVPECLSAYADWMSALWDERAPENETEYIARFWLSPDDIPF